MKTLCHICKENEASMVSTIENKGRMNLCKKCYSSLDKEKVRTHFCWKIKMKNKEKEKRICLNCPYLYRERINSNWSDPCRCKSFELLSKTKSPDLHEIYHNHSYPSWCPENNLS